jgi:putative spermidine/putrescine transport system ATP-binding protein
MASLSVSGLTKRYGDFAALSDVSLEIRAGEFMTLLGPSGSGKTTLLMIIAGFTAPASGSVRVDGADITPLPPEGRDFGMVFQGYALFPHLTVRDNVAFPLVVRHRPRAEVEERVAQTLRLVQLEALARRRPRELSGGQQQRVALARALVFQPRLLLLDEPLGALDKNLRGDMQRELKDLHERTGVTFIHVTHDQEEALAMSDRIAVLNHGRIEQVGPPREIYNRPRSVFVAGFLGANNMLPGRIRGAERGTVTISVLGAGVTAVPTDSPAKGAEVTVMIRPESLTLSGAGAPAAVQHNRLAGTVRTTVFQGSRELVLVDCANNATLQAECPPSARWRSGDRVVVSWPPEATHLLPPAAPS